MLFDVAEALRIAGVLLLPIMPTSAARDPAARRRAARVASLRLDPDAAWQRDVCERMLAKGDPLWPRLEAR